MINKKRSPLLFTCDACSHNEFKIESFNISNNHFNINCTKCFKFYSLSRELFASTKCGNEFVCFHYLERIEE